VLQALGQGLYTTLGEMFAECCTGVFHPTTQDSAKEASPSVKCLAALTETLLSFHRVPTFNTRQTDVHSASRGFPIVVGAYIEGLQVGSSNIEYITRTWLHIIQLNKENRYKIITIESG
jgi:hypothetical protein